RTTYAVIDAAALRHNFALVRARAATGVKVLSMVKADGYGHSARLVAPVLAAAGTDWFGVATLDEALELRAAGVRQPILLLTGARRADVPVILENDLTVALLHEDMARDLAAALGTKALKVHLKIDTGMGRIGVLPSELAAMTEFLGRTPLLELQGCFSHFGN